MRCVALVSNRLNGFNFKYKPSKNKNLLHFGKNESKNNSRFESGYIPYQAIYDVKYIKTPNGFKKAPSEFEIRRSYADLTDISDLWENLNKENQEKQYFVLREQETYETSDEARVLLEKLDSMNDFEKSKFVELFCKKTGFPSLGAISKIMEAEIQRGIHALSLENNFGVKFIGYDKNCSMGRKCALPGSDCDALFMVIEPPKESKDWFCGLIRWNFKDVINQRVVSTPSNHLPEVISTAYIEEGLDIAEKLFNEADFSKEDIETFENNLNDASKDFVKSAEFNIRLAKKLPLDEALRDKFYKTSMFVEILRDGRILENNFSPEFVEKIKSSPLYKYSNIMKQKGFKNEEKQKYILRRRMEEEFKSAPFEKQYSIVRDVLRYSLGFDDVENEKLFKNGSVEMGNILEMYSKLKTEVG